MDQYNTKSGVKEKQIERGGLVPVTAGIIRNATLNNQDQLVFKDIVISDVTIVGHIIEFKETETKTTIKVWEQSGSVNVVFYTKSEGDGSYGLSECNFKE